MKRQKTGSGKTTRPVRNSIFPPFSPHEFSWSGQWELNARPNFVITGILLITMSFLAWKRGCSPLEIVSPRADAVS
jgi:hypothetical protein